MGWQDRGVWVDSGSVGVLRFGGPGWVQECLQREGLARPEALQKGSVWKDWGVGFLQGREPDLEG